MSMAALSVLLKQRSTPGQLIGQPMVANHHALMLSKPEIDLQAVAQSQLGISDPDMKNRIITLMQQAADESVSGNISGGPEDEQPLMLKVQRGSPTSLSVASSSDLRSSPLLASVPSSTATVVQHHRPVPDQSPHSPDAHVDLGEPNISRTIQPVHTRPYSSEPVASTFVDSFIRSQQIYSVPSSSGQVYIKMEDGHIEPIGHFEAVKNSVIVPKIPALLPSVVSSSSPPMPHPLSLSASLSSGTFPNPGVPQNLVVAEINSTVSEDVPQLTGSYQSVIVSNDSSLDLRKKMSAVEQFIRSPIKKRPYIPNTGSDDPGQQPPSSGSLSSPSSSSVTTSSNKRGSSESKSKRRRNMNSSNNSNTSEPAAPSTTARQAPATSSQVSSNNTMRSGIANNLTLDMSQKVSAQIMSQMLHRKDSMAAGPVGSLSVSSSEGATGTPLMEFITQNLQPHQQHQLQQELALRGFHNNNSLQVQSAMMARGDNFGKLGRPLDKEEIKLTVPYMVLRLNDSYQTTFTFLKTKLSEMRQKLTEYRSTMTMDSVIGKIISQHLKAGSQVTPKMYSLASSFQAHKAH